MGTSLHHKSDFHCTVRQSHTYVQYTRPVAVCWQLLHPQPWPTKARKHFKPRLLGHWGSDAGQSFTYIHFNRMIKKYELDAFVVSGPGHGAPGLISNFYLEGVYSETYPNKSEDVEGLQRFFKQF